MRKKYYENHIRKYKQHICYWILIWKYFYLLVEPDRNGIESMTLSEMKIQNICERRSWLIFNVFYRVQLINMTFVLILT